MPRKSAGDQYEDDTGNIWHFANVGDLAEVKRCLRRGIDPEIKNKVREKWFKRALL